MTHALSIAALLAGFLRPSAAQAAIHWPTTIGGLAGGNSVSATDVVGNIFSVFLTVAAMASMVMLIFSGYQYMTARADPGVLKKAKDQITWSLIGFVVVILAYSIVNVVRDLPFFSADPTIDDPYLKDEPTPPKPTP